MKVEHISTNVQLLTCCAENICSLTNPCSPGACSCLHQRVLTSSQRLGWGRARQEGAAGLVPREAGIVLPAGTCLPRRRLHEASLPVATVLRAEGPRSSAPDLRDSHRPALGSSQRSSSWDRFGPTRPGDTLLSLPLRFVTAQNLIMSSCFPSLSFSSEARKLHCA